MTFKDIYLAEKEKPNPAQSFIIMIAQATCREEATVRQWLSGVQTPNQRAKERIAEKLNSSVDELFPGQNNYNPDNPDDDDNN